MTDSPETRLSLLVRLRGERDDEAWAEFVEIYGPLIYRVIRRQGVQHVDAEDLTQQALVAVSGAIGRWSPGEHEGSFRAWLFRIARNMLVNFVTRRRSQNVGVGGSSFAELLREQPQADAGSQTVIDAELRAEMLRWAAHKVRSEFQESTWQAFWRTAVDGEPIPAVAEALGLSVGSVYAARSRVMARLRKKVQEFEAETRFD
jgi:RNA polymerase sigma-70 factor (ECF subfamily)